MKRHVPSEANYEIPFTQDQEMASDTYYKDMWLRRNRSALQVVVVLMGVMTLLLVAHVLRSGGPAENKTAVKDRGGPSVSQGGSAAGGGGGGGAPFDGEDTVHIRGRVFRDEDDDFDPGVDIDDGASTDRDSDCCTVFDLWQRPAYDFECVPLEDLPVDVPPLICPSPGEVPAFNKDTARLILKQLQHGGEAFGFIDIGSGLGEYSLAAAALGNGVVATEPDVNHIKRFHKAVKLGRVESRITLLHNLVGNNRNHVKIADQDVKTIIMDDIPAFCKFRKAVMRLDLNGSEHRIIEHAKFLFRELQISFVFLKWANLKRVQGQEDTNLVNEMIEYLNRRGYVPRTYDNKVLSIKKWTQWPDSIYWQKM